MPAELLVVASRAADHAALIAVAEPFLARLSDELGLALAYTDEAEVVTAERLAGRRALCMFQLAPFELSGAAQAAVQAFAEAGGGWLGIHAAGLVGPAFVGADGQGWPWYDDLFGGIAYLPHPAYQRGVAVVEDSDHPITRGLPARFEMGDEWYEFDRSPRGAVRVLISADEGSYRPNRPMGDHPIAWVNERYRRAAYVGLGHDPSALDNAAYARLLSNALRWVTEVD